MFRNAWNHHGLRTTHHSSPLQLYTSGSLRLQQANLPALDFFDNIDTTYGVNQDELMPATEGVHVPENRLNLTPETVAVLQLHVAPWLRVKILVYSCMSQRWHFRNPHAI